MRVTSAPAAADAVHTEVVYIDKPETQQMIVELNQVIDSLRSQITQVAAPKIEYVDSGLDPVESDVYRELLRNYNQTVKDLAKERANRPMETIKTVEKIVEVPTIVEKIVKIIDHNEVRRVSAIVGLSCLVAGFVLGALLL